MDEITIYGRIKAIFYYTCSVFSRLTGVYRYYKIHHNVGNNDGAITNHFLYELEIENHALINEVN